MTPDEQAVKTILRKSLGDLPLFYLKFTACKSWAEDIMDGKLFMNDPEFFRKMEIEMGERGQGDRYELISIIEGYNAKFIEDSTNRIFLSFPYVKLNIQFKDDANVPLYAFSGFGVDDLNISEYDEEHVKLMLPFKEDEYSRMESKFGKYCVCIDGRKLRDLIRKQADAMSMEYLFGKVRYCPQNTLDRMKAFGSVLPERFLYKNDDLYYQREHRLALACTMPKDNLFSIGSLRCCANYTEAINLKNYVIVLNWK